MFEDSSTVKERKLNNEEGCTPPRLDLNLHLDIIDGV